MPKKVKLTVTLSQTELEQIQSYIEHQEREGWYYPPLEQFKKRHQRLRKLFQMDEQPCTEQAK